MKIFKNQLNKPLILIGLTILMLIALSYLPQNLTILGYSVKPVDLLMDIRPDSVLSMNLQNYSPAIPINSGMNNNSGNLQHTVSNVNRRHVISASISFNLIPDVIKVFLPDKNKNTIKAGRSFDTGKVSSHQELTGDVLQMKYFFDALKKTKFEKVRIAHYGDSEIEGDLITANIRQELQQKFGGEGAGFLSITSQDITFRTTTKQSFSDNWKTYSILDGGTGSVQPGISGFVAIPKANSWVKYHATDFLSSVKSFSTVRLFYNDAKPSKIKYSFDNKGEKSAELQPDSNVHELLLKAPSNVTTVKIFATMPNQAHFFGVSLESGNGIYVDNFPLRGNSGVSLDDISENILKGFAHYLNYKFIILNFGLNMIGYGSNDYGWYEKEMIKVVNHLKNVFPRTSILIIGVGDKSMKRGYRFVTNPNVLKLIKVQKNIAKKTNVAFWNLFKAMGGRNSMNAWVNANPPLAFKDYTHVTLQGAQKIAKMLTGAIIDAYNNSK